jgi:uncharacterized pyridoxal phosphate-containing UPF0001 family protein
MPTIKKRLELLKNNIAILAQQYHRAANAITLVAVSKAHAVTDIIEAINARQYTLVKIICKKL